MLHQSHNGVLFNYPISISYNLFYKGSMKKVESSSEQQHVIQAFTELAPQYERKMDSELRLFWGWSYTELIGALLQALPDLNGLRVLDLATGKLVIPKAILSRYPLVKQMVGLDITYRMLQLGKSRLESALPVRLLCASALDLPLENGSFDLVTCALATHHMHGKRLLSDIRRVLAPHGSLVMVDVGVSRAWLNPILRSMISILAFFYFWVKEGISRAWAEASALPNIRTADDWVAALRSASFDEIDLVKLKSRRAWIPDPILIQAKSKGEPE